MSPETKWTPRGPWRAIHSSWETSIVVDADGALVAEVHIDPDVDEDTQHIYEPQKDARAVFLAASPRLYAALEALLRETEPCTHESTHRGGAIWTICDECDEKWADDEGGFKPYEDDPARAEARAALAQARGES